jgi:WD40 repeat protein
MPGEQVTGDVTGLALSEYEDFSLAVVGTGGVSLWNDAKNRVVSDRSLPAAGVAYVDGSFVVGTAEGVQRYDATSGAPVGAAAGGEATVIASAGSGAIATHPDGALSIIGTSSVGLALPPAEADNAVARFGPDGTLLTVEGDPNYVTELIAVRPPTEARSDGVSVAYRPARRFEPAADWWPQEDDDFQRWYVNDAVLGHELAVAGGQDPTGSASVLVWNARTGRPIRRLPLTTGATETSTPSIVSRVALLPERELLAAYSTVQESIVLWSTATWQQIATIDVGPAGGFSVSPDESRIAVIGLSDEQSGEDAGVARARLQLIDVEDRRATVARTLKDATDVAFSPDGHRLALVDAGRLRMLAPDGREDTEPPIPIETESVSDIAWRPDSKLVAISQWHGGTILVDPASRVVSPALVAPGESSPRTLSWSPSGGLLAVTNSVDSDDHEIPVKATVWRLSPKSLEQRMCALAGGDPGGRWWRREIRADVPRRPLCLPPTAPRPEGKRLPRRPVLAYVAGNQVGVAATTGDPVIVDEIGDDEMGQVTFTWSPTGAMAWATGGRVSALRDGRLDRWNCACTAAEFDGEVLVAADAEGTALLRFGPDRGVVRRTPVRGLPYLRPEVRAAARGRAIVDGTTGDHPRLVITQRAMARPLRLPSSRRVTAAAVDPIGARALVRITAPTDECFDSDALATVQLVGGRVVPVAVSADIPRPFTVRSIAWSEAGAHAVLARADCSQQRAPTGQRMRLEPSRLIRVPGRAYDVQSARGVTATLDGVDSVATKGGTLALRYRRQSHVVAKDVLSMALRP